MFPASYGDYMVHPVKDDNIHGVSYVLKSNRDFLEPRGYVLTNNVQNIKHIYNG